MKSSAILSWSIIGSICFAQTFAWWATVPVYNNTSAQSDIQITAVPNDEYVPIPSTVPTYTFDEKAIKIENPALYKVACDMSAVWKHAGVGNNTKLTALEYKDGDYIFRGDTRSCNFSASLDGIQFDGKKMPGITTDEAIKKADAFVKKYNIASFTFQLGQWIITSVAQDNPIAYSAESEKKMPVAQTLSWSTKYQSVSVSFPILANGKKIYGQWGEPIGVSITVDGNGNVNYMNAIAKFSLKKRSSDRATTEDVIRFVKGGGNNPYYREMPANSNEGNEVNLDNIERTLVWFNYYNKGVSDVYLSTGTRFSSTKTKAPFSLGNYSQIVSDFKIGNINMR